MIAGAAAVWKSLPIAQRRMILLLIAAIAAAQIDQPYPELAPLQHGPTLALALAAPWMLRRWPLTSGAVACIVAFLLLHTLGGRYIYSYVPYDDWARALTGHDLSGAFGWARNGYDRMVHFAFGLLLMLPIAQLAQRSGGMSFRWSMLFGFVVIGFVGALYEVFEWLLTLVAEGETADWYNGQQGDVWDPQKDLAAAQAGAFIALLFLCLRGSRQAVVEAISDVADTPRE
jgi:putative membrane protein